MTKLIEDIRWIRIPFLNPYFIKIKLTRSISHCDTFISSSILFDYSRRTTIYLNYILLLLIMSQNSTAFSHSKESFLTVIIARTVYTNLAKNLLSLHLLFFLLLDNKLLIQLKSTRLLDSFGLLSCEKHILISWLSLFFARCDSTNQSMISCYFCS